VASISSLAFVPASEWFVAHRCCALSSSYVWYHGTTTPGSDADVGFATLQSADGMAGRPHAESGMLAMNIGATLALTADDVCLSIMPLFRIHG
jgi:hypothetical protein